MRSPDGEYNERTMEHVEITVRNSMVEILGVSPDRIERSSDFVNDLDADSLELVELVMALEEAFDVDLPEEEVANLLTVGATIDLIEKKLAS